MRPLPFLLLRVRAAALEYFAAGQGERAPIGNRSTGFGLKAGHNDFEPRRDCIFFPSQPKESVRGAELEAPVGDLSVGFGHVHVNPCVRVHQIEFGDFSGHLYGLIDIKLGSG